MNKFFYFLVLFFLCFQTIIAQANEGNKKIESFSKSKNFLKKIQSLSIANVNIIVISQIGKAVVFVLEKIIKGLLELNGNTYYLHHIPVLNFILGKMGILIVKIKKKKFKSNFISEMPKSR